jgi:hypothetical protein
MASHFGLGRPFIYPPLGDPLSNLLASLRNRVLGGAIEALAKSSLFSAARSCPCSRLCSAWAVLCGLCQEPSSPARRYPRTQSGMSSGGLGSPSGSRRRGGLSAAPSTSSRPGYGVGSPPDHPKISVLPNFAGQSMLGLGGTGSSPAWSAARHALIAGQTAPSRTSFQTATA